VEDNRGLKHTGGFADSLSLGDGFWIPKNDDLASSVACVSLPVIPPAGCISS